MAKLENCHRAARYHTRNTAIFTDIAVRKSNARSQYTTAACFQNVPTAVGGTLCHKYGTKFKFLYWEVCDQNLTINASRWT